MALKKEIVLDNGTTVEYHRISCIDNITNKETRIIVYSYINKEKREEEEIETDNEAIFNVIKSMMITRDYLENITIEEAYSYLKTLEIFESAEDC